MKNKRRNTKRSQNDYHISNIYVIRIIVLYYYPFYKIIIIYPKLLMQYNIIIYKSNRIVSELIIIS